MVGAERVGEVARRAGDDEMAVLAEKVSGLDSGAERLDRGESALLIDSRLYTEAEEADIAPVEAVES